MLCIQLVFGILTGELVVVEPKVRQLTERSQLLGYGSCTRMQGGRGYNRKYPQDQEYSLEHLLTYLLAGQIYGGRPKLAGNTFSFPRVRITLPRAGAIPPELGNLVELKSL